MAPHRINGRGRYGTCSDLRRTCSGLVPGGDGPVPVPVPSSAGAAGLPPGPASDGFGLPLEAGGARASLEARLGRCHTASLSLVAGHHQLALVAKLCHGECA
ncbi:hypothetical protein AN219_30485, partial [Streptomyces nanshensis]